MVRGLSTAVLESCSEDVEHRGRDAASFEANSKMASDIPIESPVQMVFGASGGIGSEVCRRLAAAGATVALASRPSDRLEELAKQLGAPKWDLDITEPAAIESVVAQVVERFGRLDGVANCVGSLLLKPAHLTSFEEWEAVIRVNLTSAFAVVASAARAMRPRGGSIVLVSSAAARIGLANHEAIAAAKAGVIGLTLSAAATYASKGIRVNAVAPGLVRTPMTERIWGSPKSAEASQSMHALGRLGEPSDVASCITWLLDPANAWVTGQVIGIDGGLGSIRSR
jgi:NAD(P)-dependent dehydrogenase (short-subunit alcohol dehydrogenase family)